MERGDDRRRRQLATAPGRAAARRPPCPIGTSSGSRPYWLGLTAIDSVVNAAVQSRLKFDGLADPGTEVTALAVIGVVTIPVQRRDPADGRLDQRLHAAAGAGASRSSSSASLFDAVFLVGIATANSFLAIVAFATLLALSTNIARGPFQGYVPDLVPDRQVGPRERDGRADAGPRQRPRFRPGRRSRPRRAMSGSPIIAIAVVELVTMLSVVLRVPNGPPPKPREGRSWRAIAAETWGTDILRETSYLWLLASRLFILMGGAAVLNFILLYLPDVHGLTEDESGGAFINMLLAATLVESARDRARVPPLGPVRAQAGDLRLHRARGARASGSSRSPRASLVATIGAALFGASQGTFLAVDWALMTDIIPQGGLGPVHGPVERRDGVIDHDRGDHRRADDRSAQQVRRNRDGRADRAPLRRRLLRHRRARPSAGRRARTVGPATRAAVAGSLTRRPVRRVRDGSVGCATVVG